MKAHALLKLPLLTAALFPLLPFSGNPWEELCCELCSPLQPAHSALLSSTCHQTVPVKTNNHLHGSKFQKPSALLILPVSLL